MDIREKNNFTMFEKVKTTIEFKKNISLYHKILGVLAICADLYCTSIKMF